MTAPSGISEIQSQIAGIQSLITSLSGTSTSSGSSSSSSASSTQNAQAFASQYAAATGSSTTGATTGTTTESGGDAVVADAKQYLGVPYVWGGESNSGLDCSGLVQKTYKDLGVDLPRTAAEQQQVGTPVSSLASAQPGDLLFFGQPAYHVAIYAGNNQLIESPEPGKTVHLTDVYQTPTSIRRIVGSDVDPNGIGAVSTSSASSSAGGLTADQLKAAGMNAAVAQYAPEFAAAEAKYHLPSGMLAAVAQQESGGNASAVSSVGAEGLMQLMPSTAADYGVDPDNPDQAIEAAGKILAGNLHHFGSVQLALAAYNAGAGAVEQYHGIPPYTQTQNYVRDITAMMARGA